MAMPFANGVSAPESSQTKGCFYYITNPCCIHLKGEKNGYYVDKKAASSSIDLLEVDWIALMFYAISQAY